MFTQWVPHSWADEPDHAELQAYADRVVDLFDQVAPELQAVDPAPAGDRPLRDGAHLRPDRRQHLPRRAQPRPAVLQPAGAGLRRLPLPDRRACTRRTRPPTRAVAVTGIPGWQAARAVLADAKRGSGRWPRLRTAPSMSRAARPLDPAAVARGARPFERARTLPARRVRLDPEVLAWEQRVVLRPRLGVRSAAPSDWPAPGDQRAVKVGSSGVLLVRGTTTGSLGVFANACRHRGHELLACGADTTNRGTILCPYHGWSYDLDGCAAPHAAVRRVTSFDRVRVRSRAAAQSRSAAGWTFVNVVRHGRAAARLARRTSPRSARPTRSPSSSSVRPTATSSPPTGRSREENYHECYHCPLIHPELCGSAPPTPATTFDGHRRCVGRRHDGADRRRRHDVARRPSAAAPCSRACGRRSSSGRSSTSACSPTCC